MAQKSARLKESARERNIAIENREQLSFMLCEAATLEHMVMCGYLFSIFTLKQSTQEGVSEKQLESIRRWKRVVGGVASQEMLHLALVNNLLTSVGAAPYFGRPNFPHHAKYFSPQVQMALLPFGEKALRHFLYLERPEGTSMKSVLKFGGRTNRSALRKILTGEEIVPEKQDFSTVGHLYRGIQQGFWDMCDKYGESQVFVGSASAQATTEYFGWPKLVAVTDLKSAMRAIDVIITEGEGAKGDWKKAHFGKFLGVLNEYLELKKEFPNFQPSRPAIAAYSQTPPDVHLADKITDPLTARVSNIFNACYEVLLQMLSRFFIQMNTSPSELEILGNASVDMMAKVISPLGSLLTQMPLGPHRPGKTAGPTFEMYQRSYLLPQSSAANVILYERLLEISEYCVALSKDSAPNRLEAIEKNLRDLTMVFEPKVKVDDRQKHERY